MNKDYINLQVMRKAEQVKGGGIGFKKEEFLREKVSVVSPVKRLLVFIVGLVFSLLGFWLSKQDNGFWFGLGIGSLGVYFSIVAGFGWRKRIQEITSALDAVLLNRILDGIF
jgi:hypothetical protein